MCKGNGNCPEPTSKMLCILNLFFEICLALNRKKFRRVYNSTNSFIVNLRFKKTLIIDYLTLIIRSSQGRNVEICVFLSIIRKKLIVFVTQYRLFFGDYRLIYRQKNGQNGGKKHATQRRKHLQKKGRPLGSQIRLFIQRRWKSQIPFYLCSRLFNC